MRGSALSCAAATFLLAASAQAAVVTIGGDPFAGSTAPTTPGRQIVAGEPFITFSPAADVFSFEGSFFAFVNSIAFANGPIASIPSTGTNVVVLRTFDDDNNTATNFAAGNAANLIAGQVTTHGAGLFVYFNQGLDLARLVYSADLADNTADLKILARMTNLTGAAGRDAMQEFTAADFTFNVASIPEPATVALLGSGLALLAGLGAKQRRLRRETT